MDDLVPRPSFAISRLRRQVDLVLTAEDGKAAAADRKIRNGYKIATRTSLRAACLHNLNSQISHERPQLEAELRHIQGIVTTAAGLLIMDYMTQ